MLKFHDCMRYYDAYKALSKMTGIDILNLEDHVTNCCIPLNQPDQSGLEPQATHQHPQRVVMQKEKVGRREVAIQTEKSVNEYSQSRRHVVESETTVEAELNRLRQQVQLQQSLIEEYENVIKGSSSS
jgi:hypothetical protein